MFSVLSLVTNNIAEILVLIASVFNYRIRFLWVSDLNSEIRIYWIFGYHERRIWFQALLCNIRKNSSKLVYKYRFKHYINCDSSWWEAGAIYKSTTNRNQSKIPQFEGRYVQFMVVRIVFPNQRLNITLKNLKPQAQKKIFAYKNGRQICHPRDFV